MAAFSGARHAVAVSSGTAGLHLAVLALGIGEGDEVVTSPFSFIATANVLLFERARPVFVDIEEETFGLDPARIEAALTPRTRAILTVHVFGRPCRIEEIRRIAEANGLALIEDGCGALGAAVGGRRAGTFGDAGVYAFYPNKQITTGEGGIVVTDDPSLASLVRSLRNQGRDDAGGPPGYRTLGHSYRMTEMQAALGASQMRRIDAFLVCRDRVARGYRERLAGIPAILLPTEDGLNERTAWSAFVVRLEDGFSREDRDAVLAQLRADGVECRDYFPPIHLQPLYRDRFGFREGDYAVAERIAARSIALPFFTRLSDADIGRVCDTLAGAIRRLPRSPLVKPTSPRRRGRPDRTPSPHGRPAAES